MHPVIFINVRRMLDTGIELDRLVAMGDFLVKPSTEQVLSSVLFWWCWVALGSWLFLSNKSTDRADWFALLIFTSSPPSGRVIEWGMKPPTVDHFYTFHCFGLKTLTEKKSFRCSCWWMNNCNIFLQRKNFQWQFPIQYDDMMSLTNISIISAVRHDRMRGGRNKFGPMYKRDRARKLQVGERFVVNIRFYIIKSA